MEKSKILIAKYSQKGHYHYPEDTWSDSCKINSAKDLLDACKEWHKMSAGNFQDYPFKGLFSFGNITFETQNIIIYDNEIYYGEKSSTESPDYFEQVKKDYNDWYNYLKLRLPKLRELKNKRLKEEKERKLLSELSNKYK